MKRYLIIFCVFAGINTLWAQEERTTEEQQKQIEKTKQEIARYQNRTTLKKDSKEYKLCYEKLKTLDTKMVNSRTYQHHIYLRKNFDKKLNQKLESIYYREKNVFDGWIENNINSTEFRNIDAAKDEWSELSKVEEKVAAENPEYFDYLKELILTYENSTELIGDVTVTVRQELIKNRS